MRMLLLFAALLGLVALSAPTAAQPAGDPVPKILEAWKKRQTAFKTVRYVVTGKVDHLFLPVPNPQIKDKMPKTPCEVPFRAVVLLDCVTGRHRLELEESVAAISSTLLRGKSDGRLRQSLSKWRAMRSCPKQSRYRRNSAANAGPNAAICSSVMGSLPMTLLSAVKQPALWC